MKARDKAKELVGQYINLLSGHIFNGSFDIAIQCALIAVDEIINSNPHSNPFNTNVESTMSYWQDVKHEIKKL